MSDPYTNAILISGYISGQNLINLTDDTNSGNMNPAVLSAVISAVSSTIDGMLCAIYQVPFTTPPAIVVEAATVLACAALYRRRLVPGEANPFAEEEKMWITKLKAIGEGEGGLDARTRRAFSPVIVSASRTRLSEGGWDRWDDWDCRDRYAGGYNW